MSWWCIGPTTISTAASLVSFAGVASGGSIVEWSCFGSVEPRGPHLDFESRFYVASIAKQFTGAAVATLVLNGRVALDDSVRRWLPDLDPVWDEVRVRHLLSHTAGLRESNALDASAGWGVNTRITTGERVAVIAQSAPESAPGTVHRYSNHGHVLLAAIVEQATAGPFVDEFARRHLFEPAGMTNTQVSLPVQCRVPDRPRGRTP